MRFLNGINLSHARGLVSDNASDPLDGPAVHFTWRWQVAVAVAIVLTSARMLRAKRDLLSLLPAQSHLFLVGAPLGVQGKRDGAIGSSDRQDFLLVASNATLTSTGGSGREKRRRRTALRFERYPDSCHRCPFLWCSRSLGSGRPRQGRRHLARRQ